LRLESRKRGSPRAKPYRRLPLPLAVTHTTAMDPQCLDAVLLAPSSRPHPAETAPSHLTPPWPSPCRRGQPGRASTPPTVARPVTSPSSSPSRPRPIPRSAAPSDPLCTVLWRCHLDVDIPPRAPRATSRSRAHAHAPVPCTTPSCTATSHRPNATLALLPCHLE
jgi:hypothetical protein